MPRQWLVEQKVEQYMGPDSLAMWLVDPGWEGFSARSGAAADGCRPAPPRRAEVVTDTLAWERAEGSTGRAGPALARHANVPC